MNFLQTHCIIVILLVALLCSCKKADPVQVITPSYLYSGLPVSDTAEVPKSVVGIGIESGYYDFLWKSCANALGYEVEEYRDFGKWELIYSGVDTKYDVGLVPTGVSHYYRVRALYAAVVSKWSDTITVP